MIRRRTVLAAVAAAAIVPRASLGRSRMEPRANEHDTPEAWSS
jgi:hypothetical protein